VSSLRRDDDIELIDSIEWCSEATSVRLVRATDIRDHSVEYDVSMLCHWTKVLRQSHIESCLLTGRQTTCALDSVQRNVSDVATMSLGLGLRSGLATMSPGA